MNAKEANDLYQDEMKEIILQIELDHDKPSAYRRWADIEYILMPHGIVWNYINRQFGYE